MNVAHELQPSRIREGRGCDQERNVLSLSVPQGWSKLHEAAITLDVSKIPQYASETLWEFFGAQSKVDEELSVKARCAARSMGRDPSHRHYQMAQVQNGLVRGKDSGMRGADHQLPTRKWDRSRMHDGACFDEHPPSDGQFELEAIDLTVDQHLRWFDWRVERGESPPPPWENKQGDPEQDAGVRRRAPGFRDLKRPPKIIREPQSPDVEGSKSSPCWTENASVYTTENGATTMRSVVPLNLEGDGSHRERPPKNESSVGHRDWTKASKPMPTPEDGGTTHGQKRRTRRLTSRDGPPAKGGSE